MVDNFKGHQFQGAVYSGGGYWEGRILRGKRGEGVCQLLVDLCWNGETFTETKINMFQGVAVSGWGSDLEVGPRLEK